MNIFNINNVLKRGIVFQSLLVGLISGLLVVLFKISIDNIFSVITDKIFNYRYLFPFITAFGGLISGYLVYKFAPEAKGSGIPY